MLNEIVRFVRKGSNRAVSLIGSPANNEYAAEIWNPGSRSLCASQLKVGVVMPRPILRAIMKS